MTNELVRFGIAMEADLLAAFDEVVKSRGGSRSEALRDLARAEVSRAKVHRGERAMGVLTLVYDHHVRELTERLTEMQHELGEHVRATMHVHLDHDHCLEVVIMDGRADLLKSVADRMSATRGVKQGDLALVMKAFGKKVPEKVSKSKKKAKNAAHTHAHDHTHDHHSH